MDNPLKSNLPVPIMVAEPSETRYFLQCSSYLRILLLTLLCFNALIGLCQTDEGNWMEAPVLDLNIQEECDIRITNKTHNAAVDDYGFTLEKDCRPCIFQVTMDCVDPPGLIVQGELDSLTNTVGDSINVEKIRSGNNSCYLLAGQKDSEISFQMYAPRKAELMIMVSSPNFIRYYGSESESKRTKINHLIYTLFLSICLFIIIRNFVNFRITRRKDHLYYALYALSVFLYLLPVEIVRVASSLDFATHSLYAKYGYLMRQVVQPLFYVFYFLFLIHFLNFKEKYTEVYKPAKGAVIVSLFFAVLIFLLILIGQRGIASIAYDIYRLAISLFGTLFTIYMIRYRKDKFVFIMIVGGLFLTVGSLLSWVYTVKYVFKFGLYPISWLVLGTLFELFAFSYGLIHKTNFIEIERDNYKNSLLREMELRSTFLENNEKQLQGEIVIAKQVAEKELENKLKSEVELKLSKLELDALYAQMNPHFLFNSLNSLKSFIIKNNKREATRYLDSLAKLLRSTIDSVKKKFVRIEDELDYIREYFELENIRFENKLQLFVNVENSETVGFMEIPPMILQPLVENAIWHGLVPSDKEEKIVTISIRNLAEGLEVSVKDNGVGLNTLSTKNRRKHLSFSTKTNRKRISMIYGPQSKYVTRTLHQGSEVEGTEVYLFLPHLPSGTMKESLFSLE